LVINDLVIAGVSGGDEGTRGFLDAYKASTGERVWCELAVDSVLAGNGTVLRDGN